MLGSRGETGTEDAGSRMRMGQYEWERGIFQISDAAVAATTTTTTQQRWRDKLPQTLGHFADLHFGQRTFFEAQMT